MKIHPMRQLNVNRNRYSLSGKCVCQFQYYVYVNNSNVQIKCTYMNDNNLSFSIHSNRTAHFFSENLYIHIAHFSLDFSHPFHFHDTHKKKKKNYLPITYNCLILNFHLAKYFTQHSQSLTFCHRGESIESIQYYGGCIVRINGFFFLFMKT